MYFTAHGSPLQKNAASILEAAFCFVKSDKRIKD